MFSLRLGGKNLGLSDVADREKKTCNLKINFFTSHLNVRLDRKKMLGPNYGGFSLLGPRWYGCFFLDCYKYFY